ncbi:WD repeat-containing protein 13-like [Onthophagus taurus]|uniref:WD repeat-containing protein 13-like n=1 Tax=Onthophagus taurus TaxID=166361 RepID=UPI000C2095F8|nr:WD repeat-containing protein 13-like [Onthophagus taurus]
MTTALQQQVFALDAKYNANRAPNSPGFRTLYIRRRSQLLRETEREPDKWAQYLKLRSTLLQQRYGNAGCDSTHLRSTSRSSISNESRTSIFGVKDVVVPTKQAEASRAIVGGNSIAENYAFKGVHHIFDQHNEPVTMVKFANNDQSLLCCSSVDGNLSVCNVTDSPPAVLAILKDHTKAVTGFDWSANNDLIASSSLDSTVKVWKVADYSCLRTVQDPNSSQILCCLFQPVNNNLLITGNSRGEVRIANVSTGRFMKNVCRVTGNVLCLASDANGKTIWAGNDKGEIVSILCDISGQLCRTRRLNMGMPCSITSLSYRAWISREARDPLLLVNSSNNSLCLFNIVDYEGTLSLKRRFPNRHTKHSVKSTFCPIMSFRQGACVVTGSDDGSVYFIDIEKHGSRSCVNTLQGHSSPVLGITFNYNESLLATSDLEGLVIIWKRADL